MSTSILDVPVLMYHRINPTVIDRNTVHINNFKEQLEYLTRSGYETITFTQLNEGVNGQGKLPSKPVLLTFDDGYADNFTYALPLLKQYNLKGTVFVVSGGVGNFCSWLEKHDCNRLMTWEQLNIWLKAGMEVGAHTVNHPMLSRLSKDEILYELKTSKEILEMKLKTKVDYFCYPYGDFDDRVKILAKEAGYKGALAIFDQVSLSREDLYAIPRIGISSRQPLWEFKLKVSRLHRYFISMRIVERKIKKFLR